MVFGGATSGDIRVRRILESQGVRYQVDNQGDFKVIFDVGDGRSQAAFINSNTVSFANASIREVWSIGLMGEGQLSSEVANALLERNGTYKLGGWEIARSGNSVAAIFKICVSADATAEELMSVLSVVLKIADEVEKEYLQTDNL
jgi:hypothetical protein